MDVVQIPRGYRAILKRRQFTLYYQCHSTQIQQGSGMLSNVLQIFTFWLLLWGKYFLKISASLLNSVALYGCLKFWGLSENLWFANLFDFQGLLLSDNFCLLELFPESKPRIVSKIFRTKSWRPFYLW